MDREEVYKIEHLQGSANYRTWKFSITMVLQAKDIQAMDARNQTPLHHAASRGRVGITTLLLTMNPDFEVADRDGRTALHLAAAKGFVEIIKLLLAKGANISTVDITKWIPLHFAARKGQDDVAALL
jgi:ankyrin repeat protein